MLCDFDLYFMTLYQKVLNFPLIRYYLLAWQRIADYKGVSNRREYWWGILSASIIIGIAAISLAFLLYENAPQVFVILISGFVFISKLQILPLSIRRLRDSGDIKNKKTDLIYFLIVGFSMLNLKGNAFISLIKFIIGIFLLALYTKSSKSPVAKEIEEIK